MSEAEEGSVNKDAARPVNGETIGGGPATLQILHDLGLNPFAVELVSESFHTSRVLREFPDSPLSFIWDGVKFTLERVAEAQHPRIRRELGLPLDDRHT